MSLGGVYTGITIGVTGLIGLVIGGRIADRASRHSPAARVLTGAVSLLLAAPFTIAAFLLGPEAAGAFVLVYSAGWLLQYVFFTAAYPAISDVVGPRLRGSAMAVYLAASYLLGEALGPLVAGALSDHFSATAAGVSATAAAAQGLHTSLMIVIPTGLAIGATGMLCAARTVGRDNDRMQAELQEAGPGATSGTEGAPAPRRTPAPGSAEPRPCQTRGPRNSPPLASMTWPVIQRAESETRNATTSAMSPASPNRSSAVDPAMRSASPGAAKYEPLVAVRVAPGATAFTVIPRGPSSLARVRLIVSTAPFVMAKDVWAGLAIRVATEESVTMRPPSRSIGRARWMMKYGARTFTAKRRSNSSRLVAPIGPAGAAAALFTRMSRGRPASPAPTPAKSVSTSPSTPSSALTANAEPPARSIMSTVESAPSSSLLKWTATTALSAASRVAIACPMPREAPVTRAVLPFRSPMPTTPGCCFSPMW